MAELHIPPGINYECTSCGKCCGGWAVPLTEEDFERISAESWSAQNSPLAAKSPFRQLTKYEAQNTPYTHKIVSESQFCPFLVDKLCLIHARYSAEFKPSICQLFPYSFAETPSGVYATVSFVSVGAIENSGQPLVMQRALLERKWQDFRKLFPSYSPDWSQIKLTVNQPLSWDDYLLMESKLLEFLRLRDRPLEERMLAGSRYLVSQLETAGGTSAVQGNYPLGGLKPLDKHLLSFFHKMYFPTRPQRRGEADFHIGRLVCQRFLQSPTLSFPGRSFSIAQLQSFPFANDDPQIEDLLYRYFYSYIFGKKYFGAGFGQVSLIAGYHHLILLLALIKLHARGLAEMRGAQVADISDVVATIRQLERQLGETKLGGWAAAAWELLLFSPLRANRALSNS